MTYDMDLVFSNIEKRLKENPEPIEKMNAIYQFDILGDNEKTYQLHLRGGNVVVETRGLEGADCRIKIKDRDFMDMLFDKLNGITAFMTGKLEVKGSMDLAMKLQKVLGSYEK